MASADTEESRLAALEIRVANSAKGAITVHFDPTGFDSAQTIICPRRWFQARISSARRRMACSEASEE
jgi:hypothetical protein